MVRTRLRRSKGAQVVRLPREIAFPTGVLEVVVRREGRGCVLQPAEALWDDFFEMPGVDLPGRVETATHPARSPGPGGDSD